jgi:hypothetical protein
MPGRWPLFLAMKTDAVRIYSVVAALLVANEVFAQKAATRPVAKTPDTILLIRQKAEAGNVPAQLALADKLVANEFCVDALAWYRKAADKGSKEAIYHVGNLLLFGAKSTVAGQGVPFNHLEGIQWTYRAATNSYAGAWRNMSLALQRGLGVKTNLAEAYAWLQLFTERDPARRRVELDALALKLDARMIPEAQRLATEFKNRKWPHLVLIAPPKTRVVLTLDGITSGGTSPLAVVNRRSLAAGETVEIVVNKIPINVTCLQIGEDTALVEVEGEAEPRWLRFERGLAVRGGPK